MLVECLFINACISIHWNPLCKLDAVAMKKMMVMWRRSLPSPDVCMHWQSLQWLSPSSGGNIPLSHSSDVCVCVYLWSILWQVDHVHAFNLCHCIYRWITLFVKRIEPSITGALHSRRAIIIIIIIIIIILFDGYRGAAGVDQHSPNVQQLLCCVALWTICRFLRWVSFVVGVSNLVTAIFYLFLFFNNLYSLFMHTKISNQSKSNKSLLSINRIKQWNLFFVPSAASI